MLLHHRTWTVAAFAILADGFKDNRGKRRGGRGVWLSDRPQDCMDGIKGDTGISITLPEEEIDGYLADTAIDGTLHFFAPASLLNQYGPPHVHNHDYKGTNREATLRKAIYLKEHGMGKEAKRIKEAIPFLDLHGLWEIPEPTPPPVKPDPPPKKKPTGKAKGKPKKGT